MAESAACLFSWPRISGEMQKIKNQYFSRDFNQVVTSSMVYKKNAFSAGINTENAKPGCY
jgi:hypothetical protein